MGKGVWKNRGPAVPSSGYGGGGGGGYGGGGGGGYGGGGARKAATRQEQQRRAEQKAALREQRVADERERAQVKRCAAALRAALKARELGPALAAFEEARACALRIDGDALGELVEACFAGGAASAAGAVAAHSLASRAHLPPLCLGRALCGMLQRTPMDVACGALAALLPALAPRCANAAAFAYLCRFAPLILDDHLTAARGVLAQLDAGGGSGGTPLLGLCAQPARAVSPLALELLDAGGRGAVAALTRASSGARELTPGDALLLRLGGPPQPPSAAAPPRELEAEILSVFSGDSLRAPRLTVKLRTFVPPAAVDAFCAASAGGALRADKIHTLVVFEREVDALMSIAVAKNGAAAAAATAEVDTAERSLGVDPALRAILCAALPAPAGGAPTHAVAHLVTEPVSAGGMAAEAWARAAAARAAGAGGGGLNTSQVAALRACLTSRLTLVQGPPGTGKTRTAAALVEQWLLAGVAPVLVTADSNTAVDNLLAALACGGVGGCGIGGGAFSIVRVGRPETTRPDLLRFSLDALAPPGAPRAEVARAQRFALKRAAVVCATCSGAGSAALGATSFGAVLVDEAGQVSEPSVLVALTSGAPRVAALFGDHKQLPPTVASRTAEEGGLGLSLFDRLVTHGGAPYHALDEQYRMHPAIAAYPSAAFYGGRLRSGVHPSRRAPPGGFPWPVPGVGLAFVHVDGAEVPDATSFSNAEEARVAAAVVRALLEGGVPPAGVGVITPYAAQVRALRHALGRCVEVSSVDGFQGRELEVVVFSAVRASGGGGVGFLADARRANVMMTRAKRGLVVLGHAPTLARELAVWAPWLAWMGERGLVCGAPATAPAAVEALRTLGWAEAPAAEAPPSVAAAAAGGAPAASRFEPLQLTALQPQPAAGAPPPPPPQHSPYPPAAAIGGGGGGCGGAPLGALEPRRSRSRSRVAPPQPQSQPQPRTGPRALGRRQCSAGRWRRRGRRGRSQEQFEGAPPPPSPPPPPPLPPEQQLEPQP